MSKRRPPETYSETLEAIQKARDQGVPLTEDEAAKMRASIHLLSVRGLPSHVHVNTGKGGEDRFWLKNQRKGPGRTELPVFDKLAAMEERFRDACFPPEARKRQGLHKATGAASETRTASSKAPAISQALSEAEPNDRTACERIAAQLNVSRGYVRKIRAKRAAP